MSREEDREYGGELLAKGANHTNQKNEIEASVNLPITTNKQHIDMECYKHGEISNLLF